MSPADDPRAALRPAADGVRLRVRLTPKASRDAIGAFERLADGSEVLIVHVRALPADGAANAALVKVVADGLGVAKSKVEVAAGHTSRVKVLRIDAAAGEVAERLAGLAAKAK